MRPSQSDRRPCQSRRWGQQEPTQPTTTRAHAEKAKERPPEKRPGPAPTLDIWPPGSGAGSLLLKPRSLRCPVTVVPAHSHSHACSQDSRAQEAQGGAPPWRPCLPAQRDTAKTFPPSQ